MIIPIPLIHQAFHTLSPELSPTGTTCRLFVGSSSSCTDCPACFGPSKCVFSSYLNLDHQASFDAYFQAYPEHAI